MLFRSSVSLLFSFCSFPSQMFRRWSLRGGTFLFRQESTPRSRLKRGRQRCAPATPAPSPLKNHPHALGENGRMFRIFISHFLPLGVDSKMFQILDASHPFVHPEGIPQLINIHYSLAQPSPLPAAARQFNAWRLFF